MNTPFSHHAPVQWQGKWIGSTVPADDGLSRVREAGLEGRGAPWLRHTFTINDTSRGVFLFISAPGWFHAYINGHPVGDQVLSPVITQFTAHVSYVCHDITRLVENGENAIAVLLGNGWYNCHSPMSGQFEHSPWRNQPSMLLQLQDEDGTVFLKSDQTWKAAASHVVMNALRAGETQDTRMQLNHISDKDFDDTDLPFAEIMNPPPGLLVQEDCEPCRIKERVAPTANWRISPSMQGFDFGTSITGWCELEAEGPAGSSIVIQYGERLMDDGRLERSDIAAFVGERIFQKDTYILNGKGRQTLHPHFCYHGFRYVQATCQKGAVLQDITACFIHNDFASLGDFTTQANPTLNRLQELTRRSYLCNFTGIPTDCPHREKNGWTGDHNLAYETGCYNFNIHNAMKHFCQIFMDTQRPSGQLPGIAPTGIWGYNWGSGPAYDSFIFEAASQTYLFTGDETIIRTHYNSMAKYIHYCRQWHDVDGIVDFGLGDWAHYTPDDMPEVALTSTCFYFNDVRRMADFAELLGKPSEATTYRQLAERIKTAFLRRFMRKDGGCGNNTLTALAAPLCFNMLPPDAASPTLDLLVRTLRDENHRANVGILGAKFVPRALGNAGLIDDMVRFFTQDECPGWGHWVKMGATSLWEHWNGIDSRIHVMFGDISACMFRYLGGIAPTSPGFRTFSLAPAVSCPALDTFHCHHDSPLGTITSELTRTDSKTRTYRCTVPDGTKALLTLNGKTMPLTPGCHVFQIP